MTPTPVTAVLSMLHETSDGSNSATRPFRGRPVLDWTLMRLRRASLVRQIAILCWDDQLAAAQPIAVGAAASLVSKGTRQAIPHLDAVTAARRWSDGWRGGLLRTCEFDRGFHAAWLAEVAAELGTDQLLLVDPAAGLVDAVLVDSLVAHAAENPQWPLVFSQAAPGLSGALVRGELLRQLISLQSHPGRFLHYNPEQPVRDPISETSCAPVPTPVARSGYRFTLDSTRQIDRVGRATASLNGELLAADSEALVRLVQEHEAGDRLPRELSLEVTTRRGSKPIFAPAGHLSIARPDLAPADAATLFAQFADAEDTRLTLGGVGDPLLGPAFFEHVAAARSAGIRAIQVQTDLLGVSAETIRRLASSPVDVVSVHIPATSARTYLAVMGVDGLAAVLENVKTLVEQRWAAGRATPIIVPVFTKCRENLAEMEVWYDKWLSAMGTAVIAGANDYAGQIPDHGAADMSPPARRACGRLASRMTILSDGMMVACEQDVVGRHPVGRIGVDRVADVWAGQMSQLREDHRAGAWGLRPLCVRCREWHR